MEWTRPQHTLALGERRGQEATGAGLPHIGGLMQVLVDAGQQTAASACMALPSSGRGALGQARRRPSWRSIRQCLVLQFLQRHEFQSADVCWIKIHRAGKSGRAHAPGVSGMQAGKAKLGIWS